MNQNLACEGIKALRLRLELPESLQSAEITRFLTPIQKGLFGVDGAAYLIQTLFQTMVKEQESSNTARADTLSVLEKLSKPLGCS